MLGRLATNQLWSRSSAKHGYKKKKKKKVYLEHYRKRCSGKTKILLGRLVTNPLSSRDSEKIIVAKKCLSGTLDGTMLGEKNEDPAATRIFLGSCSAGWRCPSREARGVGGAERGV